MVTQNHFVMPAAVLEKFGSRGFPEGVTLTADHCTCIIYINPLTHHIHNIFVFPTSWNNSLVVSRWKYINVWIIDHHLLSREENEGKTKTCHPPDRTFPFRPDFLQYIPMYTKYIILNNCVSHPMSNDNFLLSWQKHGSQAIIYITLVFFFVHLSTSFSFSRTFIHEKGIRKDAKVLWRKIIKPKRWQCLADIPALTSHTNGKAFDIMSGRITNSFGLSDVGIDWTHYELATLTKER